MQKGQSRSCSESGQGEADFDGVLEEPFPIKSNSAGKAISGKLASFSLTGLIPQETIICRGAFHWDSCTEHELVLTSSFSCYDLLHVQSKSWASWSLPLSPGSRYGEKRLSSP